MAGHNCKILYLKGKDNACVDLLSRTVDEMNNNDSPMEIDDRNYVISVTNSNLFEPLTKLPKTQRGRTNDIIREQESDQDILDLKSKIKNGRATKLEQKKYKIVNYLFQPDDELLIWFYVLSHLKKSDENGHVGISRNQTKVFQAWFVKRNKRFCR